MGPEIEMMHYVTCVAAPSILEPFVVLPEVMHATRFEAELRLSRGRYIRQLPCEMEWQVFSVHCQHKQKLTLLFTGLLM